MADGVHPAIDLSQGCGWKELVRETALDWPRVDNSILLRTKKLYEN